METVKIIECPRDAWQGLEKIIPTEVKAKYLAKLAEMGFHHLDAVSFVGPKYVPQMADSEEVLRRMADAGVISGRPNGDANLHGAANPGPRAADPEIIGIVVNEKGVERALHAAGVTTLGYPYSVSANFRRQNANMSLSESRGLVEKLLKAANGAGRNLVVYISMAFGNPFDEPWGPEIVLEAVDWLRGIGVREISLADTVGLASPEGIADLFKQAGQSSPAQVELGVHLHSRPEGAAEKVIAAFEAGCRRFDSALTGLGGCPFAGDELVGNIPTEIVINTLAERGARTGIEPWALLAVVEETMVLRKNYSS